MGRWRRMFWGRPRTSGSGMLGELTEALQPSRAHTVAEAQAQREGVYGDHRQDAAPPVARLIRATDDPAWLPPGSRAEVWTDPLAPRPTGLVRLLLRRGDAVFCVPRDDGRPDLPTATVPADDPDGTRTIALLVTEVLGPARPARPLGYVRNVVPDPPADYPWPAPRAHFTVWTAEGVPTGPGEWLPLGEGSPLSERHWYPLARSTTPG